jgi:tetratricopeptide (TPR) repeat protein
VETALKGDKKPYWNAANFYYEWDKDYPKALENVNKAIEENKTGFWMYLLKAKILRDMGNKSEATMAAQKCVELATTAKNDAYIKQGGDLIKELK